MRSAWRSLHFSPDLLGGAALKRRRLSKTRCGNESYQEWAAKAIPKTIVIRMGKSLLGKPQIP